MPWHVKYNGGPPYIQYTYNLMKKTLTKYHELYCPYATSASTGRALQKSVKLKNGITTTFGTTSPVLSGEDVHVPMKESDRMTRGSDSTNVNIMSPWCLLGTALVLFNQLTVHPPPWLCWSCNRSLGFMRWGLCEKKIAQSRSKLARWSTPPCPVSNGNLRSICKSSSGICCKHCFL